MQRRHRDAEAAFSISSLLGTLKKAGEKVHSCVPNDHRGEPTLNPAQLDGPEGTLFHGDATCVDFFRNILESYPDTNLRTVPILSREVRAEGHRSG